MSETLFDLRATTPLGQAFPFSALQGKVVLVVNTATQCGYTPQFAGLESLHQTYKDRGLAVVGFPCDQFGHQEPLKDEEMIEVCRMNHGVTFPLMRKSEVNGPGTNEVFRHLKRRAGWLTAGNIPWNFTKFVVSKDGKVKRFLPNVEPEKLVPLIEKLLSK